MMITSSTVSVNQRLARSRRSCPRLLAPRVRPTSFRVALIVRRRMLLCRGLRWQGWTGSSPRCGHPAGLHSSCSSSGDGHACRAVGHQRSRRGHRFRSSRPAGASRGGTNNRMLVTCALASWCLIRVYAATLLSPATATPNALPEFWSVPSILADRVTRCLSAGGRVRGFESRWRQGGSTSRPRASGCGKSTLLHMIGCVDSQAGADCRRP